REAAPNLDKMLVEHDSALLIGDSALQVDRLRYHTWDLSQEWKRLTGKPFVFAFWAIRERSASAQKLRFVAQAFQKSRDAGLGQISSLVQTWSSQLRLPASVIHEYLTQNIHYHLEPEFIEGMKLFFRYATDSGVLPHNPELVFLE